MYEGDNLSAGGSSVRLSVTGTTSKLPTSSARASLSTKKDPIRRELSHLAISEPGGPSLTGPTSRIPTLKSTSSGWADGAEPRSQKAKQIDLRPVEALTHQRHRKSRHDSTQLSLADEESSTFPEALQPRTCKPVAKQYSTTETRDSLSSSGSESPLDTLHGTHPRTETKKDQDAPEKSTVATQPDKSRSFLSTEVRAPERRVRSLLDPHYISTPTLSAQPSVEIISDGGEDRHLRQETQSYSEAESQCGESPIEDEDPSLMESVASMSPKSLDHSLMKQLLKARIYTHDSDGQKPCFIPKKELRRVIKSHNVRRELKEKLLQQGYNEKLIDSYIRKICQEIHAKESGDTGKILRSYRKVFALLVLVEMSSSIVYCLGEDFGLSDQDLPLTLQRNEDNLPELFRRRDSANRPIACFRNWSPVKLENLYDYQWWLLAPFLSPDTNGTVKHYVLQDEHIMPYISPDPNSDQSFLKIGGYGEVRGVQIHPDHHEFEDKLLCERGFAVKKQKHEDYRNIFKREAEILRKFSGRRSHPHIVSLLASYEQFRKIHLIFYRAQGTLEEYWSQLMPLPGFTYANINWFALQCWGIADGLLRLHKILAEPSRRVSIAERTGMSPF